MKGKFSAGKAVGERRIASLHVDLFLFFYSFPFFSFLFLIFFFFLSIFYLTLNFKSHSNSFKSIFKENDSHRSIFHSDTLYFALLSLPYFPFHGGLILSAILIRVVTNHCFINEIKRTHFLFLLQNEFTLLQSKKTM